MEVKIRINSEIEVNALLLCPPPNGLGFSSIREFPFFLGGGGKFILDDAAPPLSKTMLCTCWELTNERKNGYSWGFNIVVFIFRKRLVTVRLQILNIYAWCLINFLEPSLVVRDWVLVGFCLFVCFLFFWFFFCRRVSWREYPVLFNWKFLKHVNL